MRALHSLEMSGHYYLLMKYHILKSIFSYTAVHH